MKEITDECGKKIQVKITGWDFWYTRCDYGMQHACFVTFLDDLSVTAVVDILGLLSIRQYICLKCDQEFFRSMIGTQLYRLEFVQ